MCIRDSLKAVEQWLTLNMNMLQGTIQALEIQRGTIATLQAFGAPIAAAAPATQAIATAIGRATGADKAGAAAAPRSPSVSPSVSPSASASASAPVSGRKGDASSPAPGGAAGRDAGAARETKRATAEPAVPDFADPGLSPGAWWNLLQSQFNQVAAAALSGVGLPKARDAAADSRGNADAPPHAKPRRARRAAGAAPASAKPAGSSRAAKGRGGTRKA